MGKTRTAAPRSGACIQRVIFGRVVDRSGVGHGGHRGEPARGGRGRAGGDGLLVALAGLAQVDVHIDETGCNGEAGGVEDLNIGSGRAVGRLQLAGRGDLGDAAVLEQNVFGTVDAGCRIDKMAISNHQCRHARPPC